MIQLSDVANLPAKKTEAREDARFSFAATDALWPPRSLSAKNKRKKATRIVNIRPMVGRKFRVPMRSFPKTSPSVRVGAFFLLKHHKNELSHNRYAVIVGAHIDRRSVKRHHIKRVFFREMALWPNQGVDFLAIVNPKANVLDEAGLVDKIRSSFKLMKKDLT